MSHGRTYGLISRDLRQILSPIMPFFVRPKVQISSKIWPQIPNFANCVKFRHKSIFSPRRPVFVISSEGWHITVPCRRLQWFCREHRQTGRSETREQWTDLERSAWWSRTNYTHANTDLDMGPIFLMQPNPIQSISDPIQSNVFFLKFWPNPIQPIWSIIYIIHVILIKLSSHVISYPQKKTKTKWTQTFFGKT